MSSGTFSAKVEKKLKTCLPHSFHDSSYDNRFEAFTDAKKCYQVLMFRSLELLLFFISLVWSMEIVNPIQVYCVCRFLFNTS